MGWPGAIPEAPHWVLRNASVPRCLLADAVPDAVADGEDTVRVDIAIADGCIARITAAGATLIATEPAFDLDGGQAWPCFVDMHTHLDKGHIWPRAENADGTFAGALAATAADRSARWHSEDVEARMDFGLRAAYAHGTAAIRTHLDSLFPQHRISWPVFTAMRERWHGRIALQAVSIILLEHVQGPGGDELADLIATHRGLLGAVVVPSPVLDVQLDRIFRLAAERGLDLDFHADETGDPEAAALRAIAEAKLRNRFDGRVVVGHCCSLAVQAAAEVERTLELG